MLAAPMPMLPLSRKQSTTVTMRTTGPLAEFPWPRQAVGQLLFDDLDKLKMQRDKLEIVMQLKMRKGADVALAKLFRA
jgi:hypothetical protein